MHDEFQIRNVFVCRIAITLSADVPSDFDQRVAAVEAAEKFQNNPLLVNEEVQEEQDSTAAQILYGREMLPEVSISDEQVHSCPCKGIPAAVRIA